jgi:hypothetical protein
MAKLPPTDEGVVEKLSPSEKTQDGSLNVPMGECMRYEGED